MINFSFLSRDNRAQGKPRVYFSSTKSDFSFFEEISKDILSISDCTLFYCEDYSLNLIHDTDYLVQLGGMQLLVVPITLEFLSGDSRAYLDFLWAKENAIPILPLMQDSGLEKLFNNRCGNIQFLDKHVVDDTAISYESKLRDFLSNTLVSTELATKVRQAFDAYVFLSYRKKDRLYANEVMKKLHSYDFARDIAVWFDEYLVPGEDFNDAIMDALTKSDLFALLITPNIVNETNYVRDVEYPEAIKIGKKIVAIEAQSTDKELLTQSFVDLPTPVAPDSIEFSEEFIKNLKNLAIRENDTPEHDFYIALAYLHGIDVEVDKQKAVEILTSCADRGVKEACSILSNCYSVGSGVKIDYKKAYEYAERSVELSTSSDKSDELYNLARCYSRRIDVDNNTKRQVLKGLFKKALDSCKKDNPNRYLTILVGLLPLSSDVDEVRNLAKLGEDIYKSADKNADIDLSFACLQKTVGLIYLKSNQKDYEKPIKSAINTFKSLSDFIVPDAKAHLVDVYVKMGEEYALRRQSKDALKFYDDALKICEELVATDQLFTAMLGRVKYLKGELLFTHFEKVKESEKLLLSAISDFELLAKNKNEYFLFGSMMTLERLSEIYEICGRVDGAISTQEKALTILDSTKTDALFPLSWIGEKRYRLGNLYATNGMLDEGLPLLQQAQEELERAKARPSLIAECIFYTAVTIADLGDLKKAVDMLDRGLEIATCGIDEDEECYVWCENISKIVEQMRACL